jgi:hypothetical protein
MPFALLYISDNRVAEPQHAKEITSILASSLAKNRALSVTGALVGTPDHFAQVLEGSRDAVAKIMQGIEADPRHANIRVLIREMLPERSFARWSLAHIGRCDELDNAIGALAAKDVPSPGNISTLWNLMERLAREQFGADPSRST